MSGSSSEKEKQSSESSSEERGKDKQKQHESKSQEKEEQDVELGEVKEKKKKRKKDNKTKEKKSEEKKSEKSEKSEEKKGEKSEKSEERKSEKSEKSEEKKSEKTEKSEEKKSEKSEESEEKSNSEDTTTTSSSESEEESSPSRAEPFALFALVLQVAFIILFWVLTDYDSPLVGGDNTQNDVGRYYSFFTDVAVMMFIGFGYLMTFLRKYRYGALTYTFFITVFVIQWSILVLGFFNKALIGGTEWNSYIRINLTLLINALFASAAVLISLGGVIGKVSPFQMLFLSFVEVILYTLNIFIGVGHFNAIDIGGSIFIHTFGAYFGLVVSLFVSPRSCEKSPNNSSTYSSNTFSLIGTIFLWILWPSFNSAVATDRSQARTIINTVLSLAASGFIVCALSKILRPNRKWELEDIENATLAGGVAVGAVANLRISPGGALLIGSIAGTVSFLGFRYIGPFLRGKIGLRDTCGIHNLHGMPGLIGALSSIVASAVATPFVYGLEYFELFPMNDLQWRSQIIATIITLGIACGGGAAMGFACLLFFRVTPRPKSFYDDIVNFTVEWKKE